MWPRQRGGSYRRDDALLAGVTSCMSASSAVSVFVSSPGAAQRNASVVAGRDRHDDDCGAGVATAAFSHALIKRPPNGVADALADETARDHVGRPVPVAVDQAEADRDGQRITDERDPQLVRIIGSEGSSDRHRA
jgi:hypothetical protein